ncbi:MAG TPA: hypothetical protein VFB21_07505 [Chthonomonadaceae bacterium]|nr:hypothetical protein [Chthonomonadaceae bacterium]
MQNTTGGRSGRLQLAAQRPEGRAEAAASGCRVAFGPEHLDEEFAGMLLMPVVGQVRQQRGRLLTAEARNAPARLLDL